MEPGVVALAGGPLAGEMGPEPERDCCDCVEPAGEPTGDGEGPLLWLWRCGEACGEKGDCPWLLAPPCSPWLLLLLTAEPRPASVPVGRSSMEPDRSGRLEGRSCETPSSLLAFPEFPGAGPLALYPSCWGSCCGGGRGCR